MAIFFPIAICQKFVISTFARVKKMGFALQQTWASSYLSNFKMTIFGTKAPSGGTLF